MLVQVVLLIVSVVFLYIGAELALDAAERVGRYLGLSPLLIGLIIVGFGTSLPEFFVGQLACFRGESDLALGNIVGSNVANLFLILGLTGIFTTLFILRAEIKAQFIFHVVLTVILGYFLKQDKIGLVATSVFVLFFGVYLLHTFKQMNSQRQMVHFDLDDEKVQLTLLDITKLVAGFGLLYAGGEVLVSAGTKLALLVGISRYVVSAVFVAFGTSFPELVTSFIACVKKKNTDLITGNIIGSNIFNVSFVLASIGPYGVETKNNFNLEIGALLFGGLYLLLLSLFKKNFGRWSGILFLSCYVGIIYYWV